ncbi:DNA polymerase V [Pleurostoma richardsiae]|uniref:DNA polymerase V n=1 Tax=Pleurostoma richardsiae TaxID=41990 RepID=A0AA38S7A3_9PEZI|nr:DNA polymerase V [Pleurostoma richardsiae]
MGSKRKRLAKEVTNGTQPSQKRAKTIESKKTKGAAPKKINKKKYLQIKGPFPDELSSEDRIREAVLYEFLGSEDPEERLEAADAVISGLFGDEPASETVLRRHLGWRLFRGLASGRNASRLGYSIVITELLSQLFGDQDLASSQFPELTFKAVLDNLVEKTTPTGSALGQEERDHYFGQLFGIECYVRAKVLFRDTTRWDSILDLLLKLAKKKSWLKAQCAWVIVQAIPQMKKKTAEATLQSVADAGFSKTPDGVAIWIVALERFPDMQVPSKPWRDPLSTKSLQDLAAVLKDSGKSEDNGVDTSKTSKLQSNWTAQLHFVWDIILAHFIKSAAKSKNSSPEQFKAFWTRVVDQGFFFKNATDLQKFSGFLIFQKFLDGGSSQPFISDNLFSKNFMVCLMNQAAKEDRYLHRAAHKALKSIEIAVEKNDDLLLPVLQELLGDNGAFNFDQRTHAKTIEKILQFTKPGNVRLVIDALRRLVLLSPNAEEAEKRGQIYGDYISKLASITRAELAKDGEVPVAAIALQELTKITYSTTAEALPAMTDKTKAILRHRVSSAFAKFIKRPADFPHLCAAVLSIDSTGMEMDEELSAQLDEALTRLKALIKPKKSHKGRSWYQGLALLHAVAILELYNEEADALEILGDLKECYEKLKKEDTGEVEGTSLLLVEILLSLLARPSSLMREVSQRVFEACSELIGPKALALLTDTLSAEENAKGRQALFSTEDEEMLDADGSDSEEEDGDGIDVDSDVEFIDLEDEAEASGSEGDDEDNEDDEDEDEEGEEDEEDKKLQELDDALAKVLNSHRLDKDAEAESSDNDSDMTDSEMMALDEKLTEVFKHRINKMNSNKKKEKKDARETVVNFKSRVLDLLSIYVKAQPTSPAAWGLLLPLLGLARTTKTKALANKAAGIISDFSKGLKKARTSKETVKGTSLDDQLALLREIHEEAAKDGSQAFAKTAAAASLAVAAHLFSLEEDHESNVKQVVDVYDETQVRWTMSKNRGHVSFFQEWIHWWGDWMQGHTQKQES